MGFYCFFSVSGKLLPRGWDGTDPKDPRPTLVLVSSACLGPRYSLSALHAGVAHEEGRWILSDIRPRMVRREKRHSGPLSSSPHFQTPQRHPRCLNVMSTSWVLHIQAFKGRGSQGIMGSCEPLEGSLGSFPNLGCHFVREPGRSSDWGRDDVSLGC